MRWFWGTPIIATSGWRFRFYGLTVRGWGLGVLGLSQPDATEEEGR